MKTGFQKQLNAWNPVLKIHFSFYALPEIDHRKIASSNTLERLNLEIRQRSQVVGIFPVDSYIRLMTSFLIEYEENW
jgi:putative transposase